MNFQDTIAWVERELAEGRNDTIHDLLAYLAEQMIELNKSKNEETRGFLKWLEREIGVAIEELTNKTAIKQYHEHDFDQFLEVLKKNKKKISLNLSGRDTQKLLLDHFSESMLTLVPLKNNIQATDDLIDEIVYRLYGLNEDEVKIVRGEG